MKCTNALGLLLTCGLLGPATALAQQSDTGRERLLSTEHWTAADTNDDGTLSAAELDRAEPSLSVFFREIDTDGDRLIARTELEAWRAGSDPGVVDADELPAGEVDAGDADANDSARESPER